MRAFLGALGGEGQHLKEKSIKYWHILLVFSVTAESYGPAGTEDGWMNG